MSKSKKELDFESMCLHLRVCKECQNLPSGKFCKIAWICHGEILTERGYQKPNLNQGKIYENYD